MTPAIYRVGMFLHAAKTAPRVVLNLLFAVVLTLLVIGVTAASFLGLSLAVQGWAANPSTTIQAPLQR